MNRNDVVFLKETFAAILLCCQQHLSYLLPVLYGHNSFLEVNLRNLEHCICTGNSCHSGIVNQFDAGTGSALVEPKTPQEDLDHLENDNE